MAIIKSYSDLEKIMANSIQIALDNTANEVKDLITKLEEGTTTFKESTSFLPDLLGVDQRKRYLILDRFFSEYEKEAGFSQ